MSVRKIVGQKKRNNLSRNEILRQSAVTPGTEKNGINTSQKIIPVKNKKISLTKRSLKTSGKVSAVNTLNQTPVMSQSISNFQMKQDKIFIPHNGPGQRKFKTKTKNMKNSEYAKYLDSQQSQIDKLIGIDVQD